MNSSKYLDSAGLTYLWEKIQGKLDTKADKVDGKGLSTNDYTTAEKNKLAGIAEGAEVNVLSDWNATTGDAVILNKPKIENQDTGLGIVFGTKINGLVSEFISLMGDIRISNNGNANIVLGRYDNDDDTITLTSRGSDGGIHINTDKPFTYNNKEVATTNQIPTTLSSLTDDTTHRLVTDTEKAAWNNKSNFSGSYNDLSNKPTIPTNYAGSPEAGGIANKTASIPYAQVDSTSTATAFTATVDGITELRDGVCCLLKNGVVTSASGFTLNVNNLGAKPCYTNLAAATRDTTIFNINYTMLFVYDSTRVDGGGWICYRGYDSNSDLTGYNIRESNNGSKKLKTAMQRYQLVMTTMDDMLLPVYSGAYTTATTKVLTTESFNPFGQIYYYGTTTNVAAGGTVGALTLYIQATINTITDLRYSFNTGSTLTAGDDIYLVCVPQSDGSVKLHTSPIAKSLPTTEDGLVYKRLGKAYDTYRIILELDKPCYYYKDGAVRLWTNQPEVNLILNVTYSQLVTLRNNSQLVPGLQYRITDYMTTTVQQDTQSAGHLFDIIVIADSTNTLNENARAIKHDGDVYFADSNLAAWLIKYTLDNNHDKYLWADRTNGKGVIYWMKDEWENECPYDFKNIQFKRYLSSTEEGAAWDGLYIIVDAHDGLSYPKNMYKNGTTYYKYYYTFSNENLEDAVIKYALDCSRNVISAYLDGDLFSLNNVVTISIGRDPYVLTNNFSDLTDSTFISTGISNNKFGSYCFGNLIKTSGNRTFIEGNIIGDSVKANLAYLTSTNSANSFEYNTIGNNAAHNKIYGGFKYNNIGNYFEKNTFENNTLRNVFEYGFSNNTLHGVTEGNTFGNAVTQCEFNNFYYNIIETYCSYIKFLKDYVYYSIVEPGNKCINVTTDITTSTSSKIQNIKICQGYNNSSTVKTITIPVVNNEYLIEYKSANSVVYN